MNEVQKVDVSRVLLTPGVSKESARTAPLIPKWVGEVREALVVADKSLAQQPEIAQPIGESEKGLSVLLDQADGADLQAQVEWKKTVEPLIRQKLAEWSQKTKDFLVEKEKNEDFDPTDRADIEQALQVIDDPDQFIKRIFIHQLDIVSCLAQVDPEIWQTVLGLANEFQMTKMVLFRRETVKHRDTQTPESRLLIDLALILTKYVNAQFIKQTRVAVVFEEAKETNGDLPLVLSQPNLADTTETQIAAERINELNTRYVKKLGNEDELSMFLTTLVSSMREESYETSGLYDQIADIAKKFGILIIPTYEESEVDRQKDAELRLGIVDQQSKQWQEIATVALTMAQAFNSKNQDTLESLPAEPNFVVAKQIIAAGADLCWNTQGQMLSKELKVPLQVIHPDVIKKTVEVAQLPLIEKYVILPEGFDKDQFLEVATLVTLFHEVGHGFLPVSHVKNELNEDEDKLTEAKSKLKALDSKKRNMKIKKMWLTHLTS